MSAGEYRLLAGSHLDKPHLLRFLQATYQELFPQRRSWGHLRETVESYYSSSSPLWWLDSQQLSPRTSAQTPLGGLWMGNAIDQLSGRRYYHVFMLYVLPEYRRRGLGSQLLTLAQKIAHDRGDPQLGLQVFPHNQAALALYQKFGFQSQALVMVKPLKSAPD
ncbi:MAG: GNAT family N-acetyltransferase [Cyanobacteriota bacterium]|jgi:GNAT superfamily N-acetyltransferase